MLGTGLGHYIPIVAYLGFWVMCLASLTGRPLYGLYYMMPFIPYRTLRDRLLDYPLGGNMLTLLVISVILGGLLHGKHLPKSRLYLTWLVFGLYLYFSMWVGTVLGNAPAPLWLADVNFVTWKDYMLLPLLFVAAGLVVEDRKAVRTVVIILGFSLLLVDRSALLESLTHSWTDFDETKRTGGPLYYGANQLAAFLVQFGMFFWGFGQFMKRIKVKLISYALVALTVVTTLYTFSRAAYLAIVLTVFVLALLKDRKLLLVACVFLFTWQALVPKAVTERVSMTHDANGQLEESAQERIDLWTQAQHMFFSSPVVGTGFATFQMGQHTGNLKDTHNWYVKVLVETGLVGGAIALVLVVQMIAAGYQLFRQAADPLYRGVGLGLLLAVCSSLITNCFGDRWTYIEINGLLWIMVAAALRSKELAAVETPGAPLNKPNHPGPFDPGPLNANPLNDVERPAAPHLAWRSGRPTSEVGRPALYGSDR
jgi:O-antigen ligase